MKHLYARDEVANADETCDADLITHINCTNTVIDCIGGEIYYCKEHEPISADMYEAWKKECAI